MIAPPIQYEIVAKSTDADYYAFPSICRLANGELLCVFYSGTGHISPNGKIVIVRSADSGKSWSEPKVILDTPGDDRDPSIMQTKSGRVIVNFFTWDTRSTDRATRTSPRVRVAVSDDGGKTFAKPVLLDPGWMWTATSDEILELNDGTLVLPFYGRQSGADRQDMAAVVFSRDGGKTWVDQAIIASDPEGRIAFQEPALVLLPDGTIRCCLRTDNAGRHVYECTSMDGGRTWSRPVDTFLHGHACGLLYHSSGVIFQAYRSWSEKGQVRGVAGVFTKPGQPWDPTEEFDILLVGGDVAYPSAVELEDGSIYCVYYSREHRAIEAAIIKVPAPANLSAH